MTRHVHSVRLPLADFLAPVFDDLALAYSADPATVGRLLRQHADKVLTLDIAVTSPDAEDWQRAMATERAEATRGALLAESMTAEGSLDLDMTPDEADALGRRLIYVAAQQRQQNGETA